MKRTVIFAALAVIIAASAQAQYNPHGRAIPAYPVIDRQNPFAVLSIYPTLGNSSYWVRNDLLRAIDTGEITLTRNQVDGVLYLSISLPVTGQWAEGGRDRMEDYAYTLLYSVWRTAQLNRDGARKGLTRVVAYVSGRYHQGEYGTGGWVQVGGQWYNYRTACLYYDYYRS